MPASSSVDKDKISGDVNDVIAQAYDSARKILQEKLAQETGLRDQLREGVDNVRRAISAMIALDFPKHRLLEINDSVLFCTQLKEHEFEPALITPEVQRLLDYFLRAVKNVVNLEEALKPFTIVKESIEIEIFKSLNDGKGKFRLSKEFLEKIGRKYWSVKPTVHRLVAKGRLVQKGHRSGTYYVLPEKGAHRC